MTELSGGAVQAFENYQSDRGPGPPPNDDAMLRAVGVVALVAVAALHGEQIPTVFQGTPWLGLGYVVFIAACLVAAGALIVFGDRRSWMAAAAVAAMAIASYTFTRIVSTPVDNQDVGNWACALGASSLFVEATLLALSAYALRRGVTRPPIST
jgi:hypothetical protein